jgi:hypothetical protein
LSCTFPAALSTCFSLHPSSLLPPPSSLIPPHTYPPLPHASPPPVSHS